MARNAAVVALAVAAGCTAGGSELLRPDGGPPGDTDAGIETGDAGPEALPSLAEFCRRYTELRTEWRVTCLGGDRAYYERLAPPEEAVRSCEEIATGAIRFDPEGARACLRAFATSDCTVTWEFRGACAKAFVGTLELGEPCSTWECRPSTVCDERILSVPDTHVAFPGDCTLRCVSRTGTTAAGGPCRAGRFDCMEGLWCGSGTCADIPALGERCSGVDRCAAGSFCDPASGTCLAMLGEGQPCINDNFVTSLHNCAPPYECLEYAAGPRCAPRKRAGERCSREAGDCHLPSTCSRDDVCVLLPLEGDDCLTLPCFGPSVRCDPATQRCVAFTDDTPCDPSLECCPTSGGG